VSCTLVAQINPSWRVILVSDREPWKEWPAWMIQRLVDDTWRDQAAFRSAEMLRGFVKGRAGKIDPAARAILNALPKLTPRWPRRLVPRKRPPKQVDPPEQDAAIAAEPTADVSKKEKARGPAEGSELTERFLQWRRDHLCQSPD